MRSPGVLVVLCCALAGATAIAGCGGSDSTTDATSTAASAAQNRPAPPKADFPSAAGKTLAEVLEGAKPSTLVVSPAAEVFNAGENRYPFGVFERDRTPVADAKVALYFAKVPIGAKSGELTPGSQANAEAEKRALDQPAVGPFPAAIESLATKPAFRAKTTVSDPDAASVVYTTKVDFPRDGEWRIAALVDEGGELSSSLLPSAVVGTFKRVPRVGQRAPLIHTPTAADANGELAKITTRIPPDSQNEVDYADVLDEKPIVLLFATPQFCQSRVCGPVVDVTEQLKQTYGRKAAFIHMEIYNDNDPNEHVRPQVRAFHLPTEPWLFAIGADGRVESEIEGAFGVQELTRVVRKLVGE